MLERNGDDMGKKLPVLTEEEQEEKKLEYYQTMSALTGKSISELMGNEQYKDNYPNNDCKSKELILKNCAESITSRELWNIVKRQGYGGKYKTFTSLLVRYQRAGFIEKSNNKPIEYQLTEFGIQNAKNPKMLREECIRQYNQFQNQRFTNIINENPGKFREIYESIFGSAGFGVFGVPVGTQYSSDNYESEELKQKINNKIFNSDFWNNTDSDKLKLLTNDILNSSLSNDEKEELLIDALSEAVNSNKGSIILQKQYNSNPKSEGERRYYSILVNSINKPVTRSLYENIPFRFIKVGSEIRLKSVSESGTYRNNNDAKELDFDYVNKTYFYNSMTIKSKSNTEKRELEFYYVGGHSNYKITTMSFTDYQKAANKSRKQSVTINVQKD